MANDLATRYSHTACTFHDGCKQGIDQKILIGNRFHVKLRILSPYSNRKHKSHTVFVTLLMTYVA